MLLRSATAQADPLSVATWSVIEELREAMWAYSVCVGLAAPQIGSGIRVAVANWKRQSPEDDLVLINPVVLRSSGKKDRKRESCMSLWGVTGEVERRDKIEVGFFDQLGCQRSLTLSGFPARVVLHEVSHLDGLLYDRQLAPGRRLETTGLFSVDEAVRRDSMGGH